MQDLATIIQRIVAKYPHLKPKFTPTPPTFYQRVTIEYPIPVSVALIESASLIAYLLNRSRHAGSHAVLSVIELPADLTIRAAQHLGLLPSPKP
jgi:hypothetical protein